LLYGASGKIVPFPKSRMMPYVELGGGYFNASAENLTVTHEGTTLIDNSMESASGPVFIMAAEWAVLSVNLVGLTVQIEAPRAAWEPKGLKAPGCHPKGTPGISLPLRLRSL